MGQGKSSTCSSDASQVPLFAMVATVNDFLNVQRQTMVRQTAILPSLVSQMMGFISLPLMIIVLFYWQTSLHHRFLCPYNGLYSLHKMALYYRVAV